LTCTSFLDLFALQALLVCLTAASVAWFDPPFAAVLAVLGAVGGGLCGFVMPALAYLMVYHEEKSWARKVRYCPCRCYRH
jgi:hypothetical protein